MHYETTVHTRTRSSVKPPKSVWPSADQAIDTHSGSRALGLWAKSGLSSSTMDLTERQLVRQQIQACSWVIWAYLLSRSKILMQDAVAAQSQ